ncbi:uncharacterized protein [Miscanthus floridulus]|uniref:uncharacterized protein isoform X2 n=1 Tax=Miscanthus floridulus TaxID=154761 RepID=UPI003459E77B
MDNEPFRHCDLESILKDPSAQPYDLRLQYLRDITDDFSTERELGRGGFGVVYKGMLPNGKMIAVKILVSSSEVQQKQFKNEVDNLMRVRHQNIVQFVGYCYETWMKYTDYNGKHIFAERPKRLLCFEYMPKGSLDRYISDESSGLDWPSRYKIIKGICCGLHYLHEECQNNASVIHLDLKPANILLDDNMEPKIADFGLSKFFDDQKVQTCATTIAGSHGYMAPEYIWDHIITTKADIYSLGVIIIEMITGRRIGPFGITVTSCQDFVEPYQTLCSKQVLGKWRNRFEETPGHASPELECQQIESCLQIGLSCIKIDRMERPTAKEIIEKLHRWESTNCYASNEENSHKDKIVPTPKELLEISPLELRFSLEINKRIPCIVKLTNKTDDYVAFYFGLMMAKKNYYIEPTSGFLWPRSTFNVVVTMEEQQELQLDWQCSDEFLIQSIAVEKYMLTSKPITADLFDNMSSNLVNKVKVMVVYVPPAELPSASHTGSEARFSSLTSSLNLDSIKISYPQRLEDFPDSNRNALQQYAQGPSVEQMYHGSNFQQDTGGTTHSNYFEEGRVDGDSQLYQPDGDALPGIEGFQIAGEPRPGFQLTACGFPTNGTTLCNFQWVRHLENGIRQSIEGATMYDYVVTADDVGTLLAVDCTPMDDNGRQRHLWTRFANNGNKITCDPEMRSHIAAYISNGRAEFEVYVLAYSPEEWEVATLVLTRPNYRIKLKKTGEVIIDEKYSQSLQTKIPNGRTTQFVLVTAGATLPFNTLGISEPNNEDHDVRLRDLIVLVMRTFQKKALDSKMEGKA